MKLTLLSYRAYIFYHTLIVANKKTIETRVTSSIVKFIPLKKFYRRHHNLDGNYVMNIYVNDDNGYIQIVVTTISFIFSR